MTITKSSDSFFQQNDVIYKYTRAQAIEDGVLIDISNVAREAGIKYPVTVTHGLWTQCVAMTETAARAGNDECGRLWDLVWMLRAAIKTERLSGPEGTYQVLVVQDRIEPTVCTVKAVCGPGDTLDTVITLMLPDED